MFINQQMKNKNQYGFKGHRIKIFTEQIPLTSNLKEVSNWQVKNGKFYDKYTTYSMGAGVCLIADIQNNAEGFLCHSIPIESKNTPVLVAEFLESVAKKLKDNKQEPLTGILVGAKRDIASSWQQVKNFIEIFDDLKIKYSAILGSKDGSGISLFSSIPQKTYSVVPSDFYGKSIQDLKKKYEIVKKADGAEFIFE